MSIRRDRKVAEANGNWWYG